MNEIVNKFLLAGDKCMPEKHLRQPGFTYSACGPFTKNKERIQKLEEHVFNRTWLMEILMIQLEEQLLLKYCVIKHLILLKIQNEMDIKEVLLQWIINFLIKKTSDLLTMSDQQLAEELNKSIIRKFKKRKVQSPFVDNIWGEF